MHSKGSHSPQRGFSLIEIVAAMALMSIISLVLIGALGPWMNFKQKLDTDRRMQDLKNGITAVYESNAMAIEEAPSGTFGLFVNNGCADQQAAYAEYPNRFSESADQISRDGYGTPWCLVVGGSLSMVKDGVTLWYRNISFISLGPNGVLDPGSYGNGDGSFVVAGDDRGFTVSGREIQVAKLKETLRRLSRVGQMYETYFTTRYLGNVNRDLTVHFFSNAYDSGGLVASTGGAWRSAQTYLAPIGVNSTDSTTPWEYNNLIEVANLNESYGGSTVRSPATSGMGVLPYTALLRARVPSPASAPSYAVQTVIGNY